MKCYEEKKAVLRSSNSRLGGRQCVLSEEQRETGGSDVSVQCLSSVCPEQDPMVAAAMQFHHKQLRGETSTTLKALNPIHRGLDAPGARPG